MGAGFLGEQGLKVSGSVDICEDAIVTDLHNRQLLSQPTQHGTSAAIPATTETSVEQRSRDQ